MAGERAVATVAMIRRAIQDRACLSGFHVEFRVRFAPHALGRDENGRRSVFAFEYGGMTLGRPHWVCFVVDRLRGLERSADQWRSGSLKSGPQFDLVEIEAAVDDSWVRKPLAGCPSADDRRRLARRGGSGSV
jgi:hypothetical protein